jgi:hypothetical protein
MCKVRAGRAARAAAPEEQHPSPGEVLLELADNAIEEAGERSGRSSRRHSQTSPSERPGPHEGPSTTRPSMRCGWRRWAGVDGRVARPVVTHR